MPTLTDDFLAVVCGLQLLMLLLQARSSRRTGERNNALEREPLTVVPPPSPLLSRPQPDLPAIVKALEEQTKELKQKLSELETHLNSCFLTIENQLTDEFTTLQKRDISWLSSPYPRLMKIDIHGARWQKILGSIIKVHGQISVSFVCEECCGTKTTLHDPCQYALEGARWEITTTSGVLAEVGAQVAFSVLLKETTHAHLIATHLHHLATQPISTHLSFANIVADWEKLPDYTKKMFELLSDQPLLVGLKKTLDALGRQSSLGGHLNYLNEQTGNAKFYSFYRNPGDAGHLLIGSLAEEKAKEEGLPLHSGLVRVLRGRTNPKRNDWSYSWVCDDCRREILSTEFTEYKGVPEPADAKTQ